MNLHTAAPEWTGRTDGTGPEHRRWHSTVTPWFSSDGALERSGPDSTAQPKLELNPEAGIVLVGFSSDEGVRRNQGRVGAAEGPAALRQALGGLALHSDVSIYDAGTVTVADEDLEGGQDALASQVEAIVAAGHTAVVLGGGHETAFASHLGLYRALRPAKVAVINIDAHFDLRQAERPTSGTPFLQIAQLEGDALQYTVLGISRPNNTAALFHTADRLGVTYVEDTAFEAITPAEAATLVTQAAADAEVVHLSIDLDVLPAAVAPGVSAPAGYGVSLSHVRAMVAAAAQTGKLALVDVVELNPRFDVDGRTARAAARLISEVVSNLKPRAGLHDRSAT